MGIRSGVQTLELDRTCKNATSANEHPATSILWLILSVAVVCLSLGVNLVVLARC
jgi:hypothetical protein